MVEKRYTLPPRPIMWMLLGIMVLTISYMLVYEFALFSEPWSDLFLVYLIVFAAVVAAVFSTKVWLTLHPEDAPRVVWKYFSLGLWAWAVAELVWAIYYLVDPEVPGLSLADVFWLGALYPLTMAFVHQYRLIFGDQREQETRWLALAIGGTLAATFLATVIVHGTGIHSDVSWTETFVSFFYAFSEIAMMIAAIQLARIFGRGLWGQAWLGLLAFALSDSLYSWLTFTGVYAYSLKTGNYLTLFVDTLYLLAYLLMALSCQMQHLLVRFGPTLRPLPEQTVSDAA